MSVDPQMLAQLMQQQGGPPGQMPQGPPQGPPDQGQGQPDPLEFLQATIQAVHELVTHLPDPGHTRMAVQALGILTAIQKDLMAQGQGSPMAQRLQGG